MKNFEVIAKTILAILFLAILYRIAINGRYHYIEGSPFAIDKWTNTVSQPKNWEKFVKSQEHDTLTEQPQQSEENDNYDEGYEE